MAENSNISWTDATWNPLAGCSVASPGCHNCYAATMAARLEAMGQAKYAGTTKKAGLRALWTGKINLDSKALTIPLKTKKPRRYFVNSMSDLFHPDVPDKFIDRVFAVMALCPQHTFQVLTKRAERTLQWMTEAPRRVAGVIRNGGEEFADGAMNLIRAFVNDMHNRITWWPLPNVWLGVSVEDQSRADERIPHLLQTPAAVRFLSVEPLLDEVDLWNSWLHIPGDEHTRAQHVGAKLDWVIIGGESGPGSRICHVEHIRSIVQQCQAAGVKVFVKQLGSRPVVDYYLDDHDEREATLDNCRCVLFPGGSEWHPHDGQPPLRSLIELRLRDSKGGDSAEFPADLRVREFPCPPFGGVTRCGKT